MLQTFSGTLHRENGWRYYKDHDALQDTFWHTFQNEVGVLSARVITAVRSARTIGCLLSHGFVRKLPNEPFISPIQADDEQEGALGEQEGALGEQDGVLGEQEGALPFNDTGDPPVPAGPSTPTEDGRDTQAENPKQSANALGRIEKQRHMILGQQSVQDGQSNHTKAPPNLIPGQSVFITCDKDNVVHHHDDAVHSDEDHVHGKAFTTCPRISSCNLLILSFEPYCRRNAATTKTGKAFDHPLILELED